MSPVKFLPIRLPLLKKTKQGREITEGSTPLLNEHPDPLNKQEARQLVQNLANKTKNPLPKPEQLTPIIQKYKKQIKCRQKNIDREKKDIDDLKSLLFKDIPEIFTFKMVRDAFSQGKSSLEIMKTITINTALILGSVICFTILLSLALVAVAYALPVVLLYALHIFFKYSGLGQKILEKRQEEQEQELVEFTKAQLKLYNNTTLKTELETDGAIKFEDNGSKKLTGNKPIVKAYLQLEELKENAQWIKNQGIQALCEDVENELETAKNEDNDLQSKPCYQKALKINHFFNKIREDELLKPPGAMEILKKSLTDLTDLTNSFKNAEEQLEIHKRQNEYKEKINHRYALNSEDIKITDLSKLPKDEESFKKLVQDLDNLYALKTHARNMVDQSALTNKRKKEQLELIDNDIKEKTNHIIRGGDITPEELTELREKFHKAIDEEHKKSIEKTSSIRTRAYTLSNSIKQGFTKGKTAYEKASEKLKHFSIKSEGNSSDKKEETSSA
jgi:hypothetical protein